MLNKIKINIKVLYYLLIIVLLGIIWFDMSGNSGKTKQGSLDYPVKPITLLSPYAAGSDSDMDVKILIPYIEKQLGVPINVVNKPHNGGWGAWFSLFEGDNDGYTIGCISTPTLLTGYLNPSNNINYTYRDLDLIANYELNTIGIAVRKDDKRFGSIKDLIEYARNNEVTTTSQSVGDADHVTVLKLNQKYITNFVPIHMSGKIHGYNAALNSNIDVVFDNVDILQAAEKRGEIRVLAVLSSDRSSFLPEVWTMYEAGFGIIHAWTSTGFAAPKGVEVKRLNILKSAFYNAMNDQKNINDMGKHGIGIKYMSDLKYYDFLFEEEMMIKQIINIIYFLG